ncbi:MAG: DUF2510 domain-containing protein [Acidimicrobiales bacterium]
MSVSVPVPAGWHPDPGDPTGSFLRWWDGTQWTAHTQPKPAASSYGPPPGNAAYPDPPASSSPYPPGYGLPHGPSQLPQAPQFPQAPYPQAPYPQANWRRYGGGMPGMGPRANTFGRRNQASLTAIVVSALYLLIAATANVVFLGIFPALMCYRAFQRKETLAPLAALAVAAVIATAVLVHYH